MIRLALYQPDIPQNTGTLLRTAACLGLPVAIIGPAGFDLSDRALKRAGLDYLDKALIDRHDSFEAFEDWRARSGRPRLVLASSSGGIAYSAFPFSADDIVMMGRESAGVPEAIRETADACVTVPLKPGLRSLNVAVAAAMILGEALRQTGQFPDLLDWTG